MPPNPCMPDIEAQLRGVRVGALLFLAHPRHRTVDTRGQQVHLAHLRRVPVANLDRRIVCRHPRGPARPPRHIHGPARSRAKAQHDGGFRRLLRRWRSELEASREHRVDDRAVTIELEDQEFATTPDRLETLPNEGLQLRRCAPDG